MKTLSYLLVACLLIGLTPDASAQEKVKRKDQVFAKPFSNKKFWKADKWAFTKFGVHFKVISTELAYGGSNNQGVDAQSWAMLEGVSEETMQRITDNFATKFKERIKKEFDIEVVYWDSFKDSKNAEKVKEKEDSKEFMHKSRGALLTFTADNGPWYKRIGGFIPGGKKLAKELGGAAAELDVVIDFAVFETAITTTKDWGWHYTTVNTNVKQGIVPLLHVTPGMMENTTNHCSTVFNGMDGVGYLATFAIQKSLEADMVYNTDITTHKGEMPAMMQRKFKLVRPEMISTFVVQADEAKYEAAANAALDSYLDELVDAIRAEKK